MEKINFLAKVKIQLLILFSIVIVSCTQEDATIKVAISPYQDIAMIVNIDNLKLQEKYKNKVELITMNWEDILPSVGSAGNSVDVGFGSLTEYLTKQQKLNSNSTDPILFLYPAYIFKGGGFATLNKNVPDLSPETLKNPEIVNKFFSYKIGAQKQSIYQMMLYSLARRNNIPLTKLKITDTPLNDGILAIQNGSLDISEAGLTQITEIQKYNGRIVLTMEDLGFADVVGFICRKSVYEKKKNQINNVIKMWYDCVNHVMSNLDSNSKNSIEYLNKKAATKYTLEQYKAALSQEYFPVSIEEAEKQIIMPNGKYDYKRISEDINYYLTTNKIVPEQSKTPNFINLK